jgi:glycosyltransferase involved in cell wall biosynthesis
MVFTYLDEYDSDMNQNLAAVLLPTRGFSASLIRCIESIKTDKNSNLLRIYLLFNGKDTNVLQLADLLRSSDLFVDASNVLGLGNVLNFGLEFAEEKYIFRMDDDDVWSSKRFESQMHYMNMGHNLVIGKTKFQNRLGIPIPSGRLSGKGYFHPETLLLGNHIIHPSVAYTKKFVKEFKYRNTFAEDYDLWLRAFRDGINWAQSPIAITYTSRRNSLTNERVPKEKIQLIHSAYNAFSSDFGMDPVSERNFLLLTGQSNLSSQISRNDTADMIKYLEEIFALEFFQTPLGFKLFHDHLVSVIVRDTSLASKMLKKFGYNFVHTRSTSRRLVRRLLIW